jgi:DNA-binding transcriptional MerR regulator
MGSIGGTGGAKMATGLQVTAGIAAHLAGVQWATMDYWLRTKVVPLDDATPGKGHDRFFSFADVLRIRTVRELREQGLSLQKIRAILQALRERFNVADPLLGARIVVLKGGEALWAANDDELIRILDGQRALSPLIFQVGQIAQELYEVWPQTAQALTELSKHLAA